MNAPPPIEVRQLRKVFRQATSGQSVVAIERLDLDIAPREVVAIVGQTGCGKSTFFDLMIGLEAPTSGSIMVGGKTPYGDFDHFRGQIATVFQQDRLLPWRSALDNVQLPLELLGVARRRAPPAFADLAASVSGSATSPTPTRTNCPAACASAWRSPGRSCCSP